MSKYFDEAKKLNGPGVPLGPGAGSTNRRLLPGKGPSSRPFVSEQRKNPRAKVVLSTALRQEFTENDDSGTFQESFRVLRTRLLRLQSEKGLRSVVLTSATKGEGKSAVSLNLAFTCAQLREMKVLLIDADIRSCGLSQMLKAPEGRGLPEVLLQKIEPDESILATDLPNLYFLPGSLTSIPAAELLASRRWSELIASCSESYSFVIVDAPPILNLTDADLISEPCDGVLVVARSQRTRTDLLERATSQVDSKKLVGVILNGANAERDTYNYGYGGIAPKSPSRQVPVSSIFSQLFGTTDNGKHWPRRAK